MRRLILVALGIALGATSAYSAADPTPVPPNIADTATRVHEVRGQTFTCAPVTCDTTSTALLSATGDLRSVTFRNDSANKVWICPSQATCTASLGMFLNQNDSWTPDQSVRSVRFTCLAISAAASVIVCPERR